MRRPEAVRRYMSMTGRTEAEAREHILKLIQEHGLRSKTHPAGCIGYRLGCSTVMAIKAVEWAEVPV